MKTLLRILPIFAVGLLAWQQWQMSVQIREWQSQQVATIQQPTCAAPVEQRDANVVREELAGLRNDLLFLQRQLLQTPAATTTTTEHGAADAQPGEDGGFTPTIDNLLALGVLDGQAWVDMEKDVASMSPEENRAFWGQVFGSIERGELQVIVPDETPQ